MIDITKNSKIINIFNKIDNETEFEVMFYNYKLDNKLSFTKFVNLLNYTAHRANKENLKIIKSTQLDIKYNSDNINSYIVTVDGIDKINKILNIIHQRKNNIIFSLLTSQFINSDNIYFTNKIKNYKNIEDIDDYDIRIRSTQEENFKNNKKILDNLSNINYSDSDKIKFRFKDRVSLILFDNKNGKFKLDLTIVKFANNPDELHNVNNQFEIELEYNKKGSKENSEILKIINNEINIIKQVLEDSEILISKEESINILKEYKKILFGNENYDTNNLYSMNVVSTEVQHIVDKIPNKYAVSDKADGEKYQLFIYNDIIYLISNNLQIKKTKYKIKNLNNTILEGEYIFYKNKYIFMLFDCLYYNNIDMRNEIMLNNRLKNLYEFCKNFNDIYIIKDYTNKFNINTIEKHYETEIINYYNNLNKTIEKAKQNDIIYYSKIFLFPLGGENLEVYLYSKLIWDSCTNNPKINCPYLLDGIIYTGLEQKYTRDRKEQKYPIYKYKPPHTNSIDVYITFQRNLETGGFLEIYDNSITNINNKVFRVANLYVNDTIGNKEIPVPFMKEENNHEAFFGLNENNEVRDIEGNLVNDNTVIEIIYNNSLSVPHQYKWNILRTRWDKTELVIKHNKRYGNYKDVAVKIWKSIREAVTLEELKKLADLSTYNLQKNILSQKIDSKVISSERAQDIYYQKITNLGKLFREFNNWIKTSLIKLYCSPIYDNNKLKKKDILDIGCGRGGDIMKFYHAKVNEYVGIDPDYEGLFGIIDSAITRYKDNMHKYPDFSKVTFIQADATLPLTSENQEKKLINMTQENKKLIDKIFIKNKQFDIFNIQFAIHYLFDTSLSINNFNNIITKYLKNEGYIICTLFDANQVMTLLNNKDKYTSYYTDDNGQKTIFFEIIKKFNELKDEPGHMIDVHMAWIMQEGKYIGEYLLTQKLLIESLYKSNCKLVDTDLFVNLYHINKEWFNNVVPYEENQKNKAFYNKIVPFYGDLKGVDKESFIWMSLFRYYIFKKID